MAFLLRRFFWIGRATPENGPRQSVHRYSGKAYVAAVVPVKRVTGRGEFAAPLRPPGAWLSLAHSESRCRCRRPGPALLGGSPNDAIVGYLPLTRELSAAPSLDMAVSTVDQGLKPPAMASPEFTFAHRGQVTGLRTWGEVGQSLSQRMARTAVVATSGLFALSGKHC
jgi:hypothetical protein